jgi:hypothetical protein
MTIDSTGDRSWPIDRVDYVEEPIMTTTRTAGLSWRQTAMVVVGAAAILMLVGCGDDDSSDTADSDPAQVIEDYRIAYNSGDIDAVMAFFSEDSVVSGHPVTPDSTGLTAIRNLHVDDIARGAQTDAYKITNVEASGDNVTWDHVWTNNEGTDWCAEGHSAAIANGEILSWAFAPDPQPCG